MTSSADPPERKPNPQAIGRRVGSIAGLVVAVPVVLLAWGLTLTIVFRSRPAGSSIDVAQALVQPALITLTGVFAVLLAGRLGESLQRRLAERPDVPAALFGIVSGLSLLLATALMTGVLGMIYGWTEQRNLVRTLGAGFRVSRDAREFVASYGFKPAAMLAVFGWPVATVAGVISALIIRQLAKPAAHPAGPAPRSGPA